MFTDGTFYRIESEYGSGPYSILGGNQIFDNRFNFKIRPAPPYDSKLQYFWRSIGPESQNFKFGFKNKTQLKKWFTKAARTKLAGGLGSGHKFFVSVYRGRMVEGEKQIMFKKEHAELVNRIPIAEFV